MARRRSAAVLLAGLVAGLAAMPRARAQDAPPPAPAPGPAPAPAKAPPAPLPLAEIDRRLQRAEGNLVLHGLSLVPLYLDRALYDYRVALAGLPPDAGNGRRFHVHFSLAFCVARSDLPADPAERERAALEASSSLEEVAKIDGGFAGLWIVGGILREQMGDPKRAIDDITRGLADLEKAAGLQPWQSYQLRLFGLVSRARALLDPRINREDLAVKDAEEALALGEKALRDPRTPRETHLRRDLLTYVAMARLRMPDYQRVEAILQTLAKEDPANSLHFQNLASVQAEQQKFGPALENYRRAADLAPRDPLPHLKIAYILLTYFPAGRSPDIAGCEREGQIYLSLVGEETGEYCALRGKAALDRGEPKAAETWFRRALGKNPGCLLALYGLVQILGPEDRDAARQVEFEEFQRRLSEETRLRGSGGTDPAARRPDQTFC